MKKKEIIENLYVQLDYFGWSRQFLTNYEEGYHDLIERMKRIRHMPYFEGKQRIESLFKEEEIFWRMKLESYNINIHNGNVSRFSRIKYLIPSKKREEIIGDLMETEFQMNQEGIPKWKIKLTLLFHIILIMYSLIRIRIGDFGTSRKINRQ